MFFKHEPSFISKNEKPLDSRLVFTQPLIKTVSLWVVEFKSCLIFERVMIIPLSTISDINKADFLRRHQNQISTGI